MTWEIIAGLIALCGAAVSLGTVLARLVRTLTRLDITLTALDKSVGEDRRINSEEHADIRARLNAHEGRITKLEWRDAK
jgi:hypothetical protein